MNDVKEKVRSFLARRLNLSQNEIADDSDFAEGLGIDSLDFVELMTFVEDSYDIEIPESEVLSLQSIDALGDYLRALGF
jgi:acyl carrier protein